MSSNSVTALDSQVITAGPFVLPSQRRLLFLCVLALAALLHIAPSGWGPIGNGSDGLNAAVARELALGLPSAELSNLWSRPVQPTLVQWITAKSFHVFGVNEFAARLPFAIANFLTVALVFLIAERIGNFWRGLSSGIIAATLIGAILNGRDGGGAALTAVIFSAAFYCAVRMLEQKSHFVWQLGFWLILLGLVVLKQSLSAIFLVSGLVVCFLWFREARIRLRGRWWIFSVLLFTAGIVGFSSSQLTFPPTFPTGRYVTFFWLLSPWSFVILLPGLLRFQKVFRFKELTAAELFLWVIFLLTTIWFLTSASAEIWTDSIACLTPVFALIAGLVWDRTSGPVRMLGVAALLVAGALGAGSIERLVDGEWVTLLKPIFWLSSGVLLAFGISAVVALGQHHSRAALLFVAASMIPLSYNFLDAGARYGWQRSMKDFGQKVELGGGPDTRVFVAENLENVSSFLFYAPHRLSVCPPISRMSRVAADNDYFLVSRVVKPLPTGEKIGNNRTHYLLLLPKG